MFVMNSLFLDFRGLGLSFERNRDQDGLVLDDRLENPSKQWMTILMTNFLFNGVDHLVPRMTKILCKFNSFSQKVCVCAMVLTVSANEERHQRVCFVAKNLGWSSTLSVHFESNLHFSEQLDSIGAQGHCKIDRSIQSEISRLALLLRSIVLQRKCFSPCVSHMFRRIECMSSQVQDQNFDDAKSNFSFFQGNCGVKNEKNRLSRWSSKCFCAQNLMFVNSLFSDFGSSELNFEKYRDQEWACFA